MDCFSPRPHSALVQATIILCAASDRASLICPHNSSFKSQCSIQAGPVNSQVIRALSSAQDPTMASRLTEHKSQSLSLDPPRPSMLASCLPSTPFIHPGSSHRLAHSLHSSGLTGKASPQITICSTPHTSLRRSPSFLPSVTPILRIQLYLMVYGHTADSEASQRQRFGLLHSRLHGP